MKKLILIWLVGLLFTFSLFGQNVTDTMAYDIREGDILVPRNRPETISDKCNLWDNHQVPYVFNANVNADNQSAMRRAMDAIEAICDIRFIPRTTQNDRIMIKNDTFNASSVGRKGGEQVIYIIDWNIQFKMCHELFHCLGLEHEQSRPDRDNFVKINTANIKSGKENNFNLISDAGRYGPYDFESIMHYAPNDFSANGNPTIEVLPAFEAFAGLLGNRNHFSRMDRLKIGFLYSHNNYRFFDSNRAFVHNCDNWSVSSFGNPIKQLNPNITNTIVPDGGHAWVQPGDYSAARGRYTRRMTIHAPLGGVTLR